MTKHLLRDLNDFSHGLSAIIHFSVQIGHVLKGGPLSGNVTRDGQLTLC